MDPKLKAHLVAMGMDPSASDEAAMAWHAGLSDACKAQLTAKMAAPADPDDDDEDEEEDEPETPPKPPKKKPAAAVAAAAVQAVAGPVNLVAVEQARVNELTQLGAILKVPEPVIRQQIAAGADAKSARTAYLAALADTNTAYITVKGDAQNVAMLQAVPEAIALKGGYAKIDKPHELSQKLRGLRLQEIGRQYFVSLGIAEAAWWSSPQIASCMLSPRELHRHAPRIAMLAESVGDFPSLLLDAMNKTLRPLYLDAPKTWPIWVRRNTAPDFKNINRVVVSEAPNLTRRDAGGQINYVQVSDGKETYTLAEYVGGIKLTRKAIINDDLDAFGRLPQLQANSCWRGEEQAVYGVLTTNAALGNDNIALFYSTHKNLVAGGGTTGGPPSVSTVAAAETLLITQKGPQGAARLGLRPKFIITPAALKSTTDGFLTSNQLIAVISTTSSAPQTVGNQNPYAGKLTLVWTPVLDDTSAAVWYMAADYRDGQIDTIELSFLEGEPEPVLRQETEFDSEDVKFAVRHTFAAKALDFRGLVKNPGA